MRWRLALRVELAGGVRVAKPNDATDGGCRATLAETVIDPDVPVIVTVCAVATAKVLNVTVTVVAPAARMIDRVDPRFDVMDALLVDMTKVRASACGCARTMVPVSS